MISIVRFFGAPVIEPPGKQARMQSVAPTSGRGDGRRTVDTSWCTVS